MILLLQFSTGSFFLAIHIFIISLIYLSKSLTSVIIYLLRYWDFYKFTITICIAIYIHCS
nr:MAG TPA: hypothetical protein [Caudoviricetes sp.]